MNRRGFLGTILAAAVAPAIVRADALMRIVPREATVLTFAGDLMDGEIGRYMGVTFYESRVNYGQGLAICANIDGGLRYGLSTPIGVNDSNIAKWREHMKSKLYADLITSR